MDENMIKDLIATINSLELENINSNANEWKVGETSEQLIYTLAFNDGVLSMAEKIKKFLRDLLPAKFEVNADDQS